MATIKLNGQSSPSNMLCFSDSINIVEYSDDIIGTKASIVLTFSNDLRNTTIADSQYYLTILDETITNVMSPKNATNKRFYIGSSAATAAYAANALNACESLSADWDIYNSGNVVTLKAKTIGQKLTNVSSPISTNIPSSGMSISSGDGSASSSAYGGKVLLQVSGGGEVIRLEKSVYDSSVGFNVSPLLSSLSEYGRDTEFTMRAFELRSNGNYSDVGSAITSYCTYGYLANQSLPYLTLSNSFLLNNKRGESDITLYTYENRIPFSILSTGTTPTVQWKAFSSTGTLIRSGNVSSAVTNGHITDLEAVIPTTAFTDAFYIYLQLGSKAVKFNVIKPLKMAEGNTRIYWRNEYGGLSFFDFTGQRQETDSVDVETYNVNFYDFYDNPNEFEEKTAYRNTATKEVKLTSHLMEESGKWIGNSLIRSRKLWTYVNGNKQYIIPKSMEVNEDQTYNGIYTITFTFEYSQLS